MVAWIDRVVNETHGKHWAVLFITGHGFPLYWLIRHPFIAFSVYQLAMFRMKEYQGREPD